MSYNEHQPVLECQACGEVVRYLTAAEAQQVADNPYNFIVFCGYCIRMGYHIEPGYGY